MATKPLKELLAQADAFIKTASATTVGKPSIKIATEVENLVEALGSAETGVVITAEEVGIDKIAESLNRVHTLLELDVINKYSNFEKKAEENGYSKEQIEEAFSKIAAEKTLKNLPVLAALGVSAMETDEDAPPQVKKVGKRFANSLNLSKSVGY